MQASVDSAGAFAARTGFGLAAACVSEQNRAIRGLWRRLPEPGADPRSIVAALAVPSVLPLSSRSRSAWG